jgi:alpha-mannosidase
LVHLFDRVLDDIESKTLKGFFTLDGQAILLEDYLEIRPERHDQVARYVKAGRLIVGPWYVMPDEWLVSGEALVRISGWAEASHEILVAFLPVPVSYVIFSAMSASCRKS